MRGKPGRPKGSKNIVKRGRPPVAAAEISRNVVNERFEDGSIAAFLLTLPATRRKRIIQAVELVT